MRRFVYRNAHLFAVLVLIAGAFPAFGQANRVLNGGFEDVVDGRPAHWALEGDATVVQTLTSDAGVTAGRAAKLDCTAFRRTTRDGYAMLVQRAPFKLEEGKWYRFSCWTRQEGMGSGLVTVELMADTQAVNPYSTIILFQQIAVQHQWHRTERYFRASPATAENAKLHFYFDFTGTLWVDDVEIVEAEAPQVEYTHKVPNIASANLIPNGSFECGPDLWSSLGKKVSIIAGLSELHGKVQTGDAWDGDSCLRIEMGPGKSPVASFNYQVTYAVQHQALAANIGWVDVTPDEMYTLSAYMRADKPGVPAKLMIRFGIPLEGSVDSGSYFRQGQSDATESVVLGTEWKRYTLTAPARSRHAFVAVGPDMTDQPDTAATIWLDAVQLETGREATAFAAREPLEIGLATGKTANIFDAGEEVAVAVQAANRTSVPADVTLEFKATDYFDRTAAEVHHRLEVPARNAAQAVCPLGIRDKGFYWVAVSWEAGGRKQSRKLRVAVVEPYPHKDSVFGINHAPGTDQLCAVLVKSGTLLAREWSMEWQQIEPAPGAFRFEMADRHVNRVLGTGMSMAEQVPPFPSADWNTSAPPEAKGIVPDMGWGLNMYAPKDPEAMRRYIETVVGHYKDRIHVWEYLNEPIYTFHSLPNVDQVDATIPTAPGANYTVEDLVALQQVFYESVKRADPKAITICGLGGRPDLLAEEYFKAGGLKYLDAFNLHIYPGKRKPEGYVPQMKLLLQQMDQNVDQRRPIWITEYCYYGVDELPIEPYITGAGGWAENRLLRDAKECGDYGVRFAAIMLAHGAEKICYHSGFAMSDDVNSFSVTDWMTVHGGEPRKAYASQTAMADMLGPSPKFAAEMAKPDAVQGRGTDAVYAYAFQCGGRAVLIAWAPAPDSPPWAAVNDSEWALELPGSTQAYDVVGVPLRGNKAVLGESPVYVVSEQLSASDLAKACRLVLRAG